MNKKQVNTIINKCCSDYTSSNKEFLQRLIKDENNANKIFISAYLHECEPVCLWLKHYHHLIKRDLIDSIYVDLHIGKKWKLLEILSQCFPEELRYDKKRIYVGIPLLKSNDKNIGNCCCCNETTNVLTNCGHYLCMYCIEIICRNVKVKSPKVCPSCNTYIDCCYKSKAPICNI